MTLAFTTHSFAQGCANCYTTTAAGGTQTIHALRSGILMLLIPPVIMFACLVWTVWRWRSMRQKPLPSVQPSADQQRESAL